MLKRRIKQLRESSKVSIAQKFRLRICDTYVLIEYHDIILCYMNIEISASIEQFMWHVVDITFSVFKLEVNTLDLLDKYQFTCNKCILTYVYVLITS